MANIEFDTSDFENKATKLLQQIADKSKKAVHDVATEVLRLSQFEVPHDTGLLQNSGIVQDQEDGSIVGYNKVYAARLHEHPEYHFQAGRKGKYLEDPIRNNLETFRQYFSSLLG